MYVISPEIPKVDYLTKLDIYLTGTFIQSFYVNLQYAFIMFLLKRKHKHAALYLDIVHRIFTVPLIGFFLWGLFTKNPRHQEPIIGAGVVISIISFACACVYVEYLRQLAKKKAAEDKAAAQKLLLATPKDTHIVIGPPAAPTAPASTANRVPPLLPKHHVLMVNKRT
jgi:hypothetical protein